MLRSVEFNRRRQGEQSMIDTQRSRVVGLMVMLLCMSTSMAFAQAADSVFRDCPDCAEMVVIPAGSFLMGSKPVPVDPFSNEQVLQPPEDEQPQHNVTLQSFALGKYDVTQEQWYALMGVNPSSNKGRPLPVENVSWDDVQVFIQKLNAQTGKRYRLPTEAEWEYAARAGSTTAYAFGDDASQLGLYAWFAANSDGKTHPVGEKQANGFGLYDMHGDVWQWVQDCYVANYVGAPADGSAVEQPAPCLHVLRGGSWNDDPVNLRSAARSWYNPGRRSFDLGFRLARTLP